MDSLTLRKLAIVCLVLGLEAPRAVAQEARGRSKGGEAAIIRRPVGALRINKKDEIMRTEPQSFGSVLQTVGLSCAVLLLTALPVVAQESLFRVTVAAANIREEPTTASAIVGRAERGVVLRVLTVQENWVRVLLSSTNGFEKIGYISAPLGTLEAARVIPAKPAQVEAPTTTVPPVIASTSAEPSKAPPVAWLVSEEAPGASPPSATQRPSGSVAQPIGLAPTERTYSKREPVVSLLLSAVFPGMGQLYNGPSETKKGVIMAGVGAASLILAIASAGCDYDGLYDYSCGSTAGVALGLIAYSGVTIYSMVDAATRAGELNRHHGLALDVKPEQLHGRTGVRASLSYSFEF